ncbi:GNAT family N-acetyltransferase [Petrocella atlantisensis]|uniref:GNAT family N-acetyltransferase n=1 Tax=Petrocella atlantisensis TaxID=2173034 RepID=A0A3P7S2T3_9FIRM|nr:GNAT family N-acetyltransferase [Petrocella atlantisensis]MCF8020971.1 GNAT family N-acetyltransferase [Vallitaleaceae bacterium]VDN47069.1 GNAT family N-acetyltransferase [Petrocella atlantisensis]
MEYPRLVRPDIKYKDSFLEFVEDVKSTGYESYELYRKAVVDFDGFIKDLCDSSEGLNLPEGWVPCSSFWLVDNTCEVLGVIRIRHRVDSEYLQMLGHIGYEIKSNNRRKGYGSRIFELGLIESRKIGLRSVLVTCNEDNIGSMSIILQANGKFTRSFKDDETGKKVMQYEVLI